MNSAKEDVLEQLSARPELTHIDLAVVDPTGQLRGKTVSREKFEKALSKGIPFTANFAGADHCDAIFPVEGIFEGDIDLHDSVALPATETMRVLPWASPRRNLMLLMDYADDAAEFACPRTLLKQQLGRLEQYGFSLFGAFELEFRLFQCSTEENLAANYRDLLPSPARQQCMGMMRHHVESEFPDLLLDTFADMGIDIECYHLEVGAGFHELVLRYQEGIRSADDCAYIKFVTKVMSQRHNRMASFMARCLDDEDGSSFHSHFSLRDREGAPAFYDREAQHHVSDTMRHFVGGLQHRLPELQLMLAPNVNSYRRYQPGIYAPVAMSWGVDNRTVGLRVLGCDSPEAIRIENRLPGADANPYLVQAATLAAGLWGIENRVQPIPMATGNSWDKLAGVPDSMLLTDDMSTAIDRFSNSAFAREHFGDKFVDIFAANRDFHRQDFLESVADSGADLSTVTDWELNRLFESA